MDWVHKVGISNRISHHHASSSVHYRSNHESSELSLFVRFKVSEKSVFGFSVTSQNDS